MSRDARDDFKTETDSKYGLDCRSRPATAGLLRNDTVSGRQVLIRLESRIGAGDGLLAGEKESQVFDGTTGLPLHTFVGA